MKKSLLASLVLGATFAVAGGFTTDVLAAKAPKPKAEPAKPAGQVVEYAALENHVGDTLAIDTTFKTTRTGKLVKWTQPTLTVDMGTAEKPMELTVPKETIVKITVVTPPAADTKDTGKSGAKKN
jgi:nitric oxide synthase oxygenase domain/subunit